jgi:5'-3' exonuclease
MKSLIDGDIILFRAGYSAEMEPVDVALSRAENLVQGILTATKATDHCIYFSDGRENTFRSKMCPEYKAHRVQEKPVHYPALKDFLLNSYDCQQEVEQEADDGMGIAQREDTVICSIDKDMLQIPGYHYNFVKDQHTFIEPEEGLLFFYKQMLIGDTADNIKGCQGIGQAKAGKLLDHLLGESGDVLFTVVQEAYRSWLEKEWQAVVWGEFQEKQMNNLLLLTGRLLKIRQKEGEIWNFPKGLNISPEATPQL